MNIESSTTRLFVAIDVPQDVKNEVVRIQHELHAHNVCEGRFTDMEDIHITLSFMPDVANDQIDLIKYALNTIKIKKMIIYLDRLDLFMRGPLVKIILIRINALYIADLAVQIERCLLSWVPVEKREFIPHLTIARVKKVPDLSSLLTFTHDTYIKPLPFVADHFMLKQSQLTLDGPMYTDIARFNLID